LQIAWAERADPCLFLSKPAVYTGASDVTHFEGARELAFATDPAGAQPPAIVANPEHRISDSGSRHCSTNLTDGIDPKGFGKKSSFLWSSEPWSPGINRRSAGRESRRNQSICHSDRAHPGEPAGSWARTERFAKVGDSRVPPCPNSTVFTYLRRVAAQVRRWRDECAGNNSADRAKQLYVV